MSQIEPAHVASDPAASESGAPVAPAGIVSSKGRIYRPELDVLRFLAFLGIFVFHGFNLKPETSTTSHGRIGSVVSLLREVGAFGLPLFFLLSAYLNTALLRIEKARTGTLNLRKFYYRRALRVWPLYFFYLAVAFLIGVRHPAYAVEPMRILALLLLAGNWFALLVSPGAATVWHLWSISVEEQFYLLLGPFLRLVTITVLRWSSVALLGLSLITVGLLRHQGSSLQEIRFNSFAAVSYFAAGTLLALHLDVRDRPASHLRASGLLVAGFAVWIVAELTCHVMAPDPAPGGWQLATGYVLVILGSTLLVWGFLYLPRVLAPSWLAYLGRISYGLYVYQVIAMYVVGVTVGRFLPVHGLSLLLELLADIGLAALSYALLEKPFLKLKNRFEFVRTGPA